MEQISIPNNLEKKQKYEELLPQLFGLLGEDIPLIANLANCSAALKEVFNHWWIGFYLVNGQKLVLGPFQGPVACTSIGFGKGVCGTSWEKKETIIVDNVDLFPGHIACSAFSKSEIVVPIIKNQQVVAVLDIDSENFAEFDLLDKLYLEKIAHHLANFF